MAPAAVAVAAAVECCGDIGCIHRLRCMVTHYLPPSVYCPLNLVFDCCQLHTHNQRNRCSSPVARRKTARLIGRAVAELVADRNVSKIVCKDTVLQRLTC